MGRRHPVHTVQKCRGGFGILTPSRAFKVVVNKAGPKPRDHMVQQTRCQPPTFENPKHARFILWPVGKKRVIGIFVVELHDHRIAALGAVDLPNMIGAAAVQACPSCP